MQAQGIWSAGEGDDKERFLADLRALRDTTGLEFDELAARAHYPSDVLKKAENGPSLPGLPILAAYVRACDGDVPEWEERWRRLGFESRADPSLPVRPAGASPAAVAGARAAVSVAPPDAYDPERIRAALRGSHGRSDRGDRAGASQAAPGRDAPGPATAEPRVPESPAAWSGGASWDGVQRDGVQRDGGARWDGAAADSGGTHPNGNYHASRPGDGSSDPPVAEPPDATSAGAIRRDLFSDAWRHDGDPAPPAEPASGWPGQPEAGSPDSWFTPREKADGEHPGPTADAEPSPAAADGWFGPRERADSGVGLPRPAESDVVPPQERSGSAAAGMVGFFTPSADASAAAEAQRPGPSPTEGQAIQRAAWTAPAETPASEPPGAADRTLPIRPATATPSRTKAGPTPPPGPVVPRSPSRSDRLFPVRLLVIIVVAALIGSVLVLLLR